MINKYILVTQEIQDGDNRYTIRHLDFLINQDLQEEIDKKRKEYNDYYESDNRALRHFYIQEINKEEYDILAKYI